MNYKTTFRNCKSTDFSEEMLNTYDKYEDDINTSLCPDMFYP